MPKMPKLEIALSDCSEEMMRKIFDEAGAKQFTKVYQASNHRRQRKLDKMFIRAVAAVAKKYDVKYIVAETDYFRDSQDD